MKIEWTDNALEQLRAIQDYIAWNSPEYARRLIDRITRRSQQIAIFPRSGRMVSEYDMGQIREVIESPYRIIYYIKPDQIDILAVIHQAQQPPWKQ